MKSLSSPRTHSAKETFRVVFILTLLKHIGSQVKRWIPFLCLFFFSLGRAEAGHKETPSPLTQKLGEIKMNGTSSNFPPCRVDFSASLTPESKSSIQGSLKGILMDRLAFPQEEKSEGSSDTPSPLKRRKITPTQTPEKTSRTPNPSLSPANPSALYCLPEEKELEILLQPLQSISGYAGIFQDVDFMKRLSEAFTKTEKMQKMSKEDILAKVEAIVQTKITMHQGANRVSSYLCLLLIDRLTREQLAKDEKLH